MVRHRRLNEFDPLAGATPDGSASSAGELLATLRAHRRVMLTMTALGVGLAALYAAASPPLYAARAQLLLSPRAMPTASGQASAGAIEPAQIESEIVVMRSERVAEAAIRDVDPQLAGRAPLVPLRAWLRETLQFNASEATDPFLIGRRKLDIVARRLSVRRIGFSNAIELTYASGTPEHAAAMANAITAAFIRERASAREDAARESALWLETRIEEVRRRMSETTAQAQKRRAQRDYRIAGAANAADATSVEELDSQAASYTRTYESYLQALTDNAQRQALTGVEARVITRASAAAPKTQPSWSMILALGALGGGLGGVALSFLREGVRRAVRSPADLSAATDLECVGVLPRIARRGWRPSSRLSSPLFEVAAAPFSRFSDSLKRVQTALAIHDRETPTRRIGVVSALGGEGKTTFLCNLAELLAASGSRVVVVDADLRKPALSRALAPGAAAGLIEALRAPAEAADFVVATSVERIDILPSAGDAPVASHDLLGSPAMAEILQGLAGAYDYVLVDLPPLTLLPDGYAIGHLLDGMILLACWNKTPMATLREVADGLRAAGAGGLAAVLTGVETTDAAARPYYGA